MDTINVNGDTLEAAPIETEILSIRKKRKGLWARLSGGSITKFGEAPLMCVAFIYTLASLLYMLVIGIATGFYDLPFRSLTRKVADEAGLRAKYASNFIAGCGNYGDEDRKKYSLGACAVALLQANGETVDLSKRYTITTTGTSISIATAG